MKKLNFCCGNDIRNGWDNHDIQEKEGILSFDANEFPYPIKDGTYDYIEIKQALQCLNDPENVLYELRRIAKHNAIIHIVVSWWHNKGAYNDIQTKHWFNENSFIMFANQKFPYLIKKNKIFKIIKLEKQPTNIGKIIPRWLREKLDLFISGLISDIDIELKVIK